MLVKNFDCIEEKYIGDSVGDADRESYSVDDCVLVRTTDCFPFDRVVQTPVHGNAVIYGDSYIMDKAVGDLLREKYKNRNSDKEEEELFFKELHDFDIVSKSYRSTIHFTINGLVSSHLYGNFDGRSFVIIEPLKYHIKDKTLLSLNACDTYFNDDMVLSSEAVLLIDRDTYDKIKDDDNYKYVLDSMRIYTYVGNQQEAVKLVLEDLGYDSFIVNNHGYVNGLDSRENASKMWDSLFKIREEYGLEVVSHFESYYNYEDLNVTNQEGLNGDINHFLYVVDRAIEDGLIDEEYRLAVIKAIEIDKEREINYENEYYGSHNYKGSMVLKIVPEFIKKIGLDNVKKYTFEYNEQFIRKLNNSNGRK